MTTAVTGRSHLLGLEVSLPWEALQQHLQNPAADSKRLVLNTCGLVRGHGSELAIMNGDHTVEAGSSSRGKDHTNINGRQASLVKGAGENVGRAKPGCEVISASGSSSAWESMVLAMVCSVSRTSL